MRRCGSSGERFAISAAASSSAALSRCQSATSASLGGVVVGVERQCAADAARGALEAQQHVLARDRGRLAGDGCRDERVAVAVAADPRADPHERAHDGRAAARRRPLQRVVDAAVDVRDGGVERLVEDGHHRADLVGRGRLLGPQRRGAPQRVDLFEHAPLGAALIGTLRFRRRAATRRAPRAVSARRRMLDETARRRASVGCAVKTGWNRMRLQPRSAVSSPTSAASRTNAAATESVACSRSGRPSRSRRMRTRWCSSARFTRWK